MSASRATSAFECHFLRAGRQQVLERLAVAVDAHRERKSLGHEVLRDAVAHEADADESDAGLAHCGSSMCGWGLRDQSIAVGSAGAISARRRSCHVSSSPLPPMTAMPTSVSASGKSPNTSQPTSVANTRWA